MPKSKMKRTENALIKFGRTFPEVAEECPWDHTVSKVPKKLVKQMDEDK